MALGLGMSLIGFGAFTPAAASGGLDGSESDGVNLLTGTNAMTSGWTTLDTTLTNAAAVASDGTTTASSMLEAATTARHGVYQLATIGGGNPAVNYSCYAKQVTRRYLQILIVRADTGGRMWAYYDLQAGTVTDSGTSGIAILNSTAIAAGANGYYKCTLNGNCTAGGNTQAYVSIMASNVATYGAPLDSDSPSYLGVITNGAYLWRPKAAL